MMNLLFVLVLILQSIGLLADSRAYYAVASLRYPEVNGWYKNKAGSKDVDYIASKRLKKIGKVKDVYLHVSANHYLIISQDSRAEDRYTIESVHLCRILDWFLHLNAVVSVAKCSFQALS